MEPLALTNYFYVSRVKGIVITYVDCLLSSDHKPEHRESMIHSFIVSRRKDDSQRRTRNSPNPNPNPKMQVT